MKKVFIISVVLLFLVGSFYIVYNLFLSEEGTGVSLEKITKSDKKNTLNLDKVIQLTKGGIKGLTLSEDNGKIQYYSNEDKGFRMTSFDGESIKKKLSSDDFGDVDKIIWNKNKKDILLKKENSFYLYSFGEKEKFIKNSSALNWINFDQKIVYTYKDQTNGKKTLNIANPDGSSWKEIATIESDEILISNIPRSAKASYWPYPSATKKSNLTIIPFGNGELEKKGDLKFGSDYLWSNDGNKFLRSSTSQEGGNSLVLEACDAKTGNCLDLKLPTLVSKCAWMNNDKSVYCAMPTNVERNLVMPDDYLSGKFYTKDLFWKINIENAKKEKIIEEKYLKQELDATNLVLTPNNDFLFFIDRKSGELFRVIL